MNAVGNIQLFSEMNRQGNVEIRGGARITEPLFTDLSTTVKVISGGDTFDASHQQPFTVSYWTWKQFVAPITVFMDELLKNQDPEGQVPLLAGFVEAMERSLWSSLSDATVGLFSNNGDATTGLSGLASIVSSAPAGNTVGNIAGSATAKDGTAFWQNIVGTAITAWNTNGITNVRDAALQCARGEDQVNLHVTTRTGLLRFIGALTQTYRYNLPMTTPMGAPATMDTGAAHVVFDGAPVIFDVNTPADTWRGLNTRYLKLAFMRNAEFVPLQFVRPYNATFVTGAIYTMLELFTNNRRRHFYLAGANSAA